MTEKELSQYRKLKREAEDLQNRIDKQYDKEIDTGHSTVRGSSNEFPYTEFHFGVWVDDPKQIADRDKLIKVYSDRMENARKEILRIEQFISDIQDSELRQIFEYRFVDGLTQRQISKNVHLDQSVISRKIRNYIIQINK
ncbi:hypothetical protein [Anaerocolumna sp.]|uniref:hypothetical protein n=1 Tax=Anaerocolumna sp. TaxID=2041569 RepID=UPI0028AEF258|nr:hypothetical protein [Anaerocolumna sp.]